MYSEDMLCESVPELLSVMREESARAVGVLCADNPGMQWIGFSYSFAGGTITHTLDVKHVKEWAPDCPDLRLLLLSVEGRKSIAQAALRGHPWHEDCPICLVEHVMTA